MVFLHFADFLGFEFVRVFVGFELKWAQQFAKLLGAVGCRHLRLLSLSGPARGPAWLALRPPLPPALGAAALLWVRGGHPSCRRRPASNTDLQSGRTLSPTPGLSDGRAARPSPMCPSPMSPSLSAGRLPLASSLLFILLLENQIYQS